MKLRFLTLFTLLLVCCTGLFTQAEASAPAVADTTIYDVTASQDEGDTYIRYTGSVDMSTDSVGTYYTQALFIANANQATSVIRAQASDIAGQTEDVDVTLELSPDARNWTSVSTLLYEALGTTTTYDTLSANGGLEYKGSLWMRLKIVGQTGNPSTTVSYDIYLPKNTGAPPIGAGMIEDRRT